MNQDKYLLALNAHQKIGSQTIKKILNVTHELSVFWQKSEKISSLPLDEKIRSLISETVKTIDPDHELVKLLDQNVGYVTIFDKNYPPVLKQLPDCPAVLYIRGSKNILDMSAIGVVGSRKYTDYGLNSCQKLVAGLATQGVVVISGLALGIDAIAHKTTLDNGGKTVAVLGCGLDQIYPSSNYQLGKKIIENGGAIISEYSLGTPPMKQNFPARNRIIAGLSLGVLVVEASVDSGSLITAMCALDYNRDVFAVPGNIDNESSLGTNMLIQQGAKLVISSDDILSEINIKKKTDNEVAKKILPVTADEVLIISVLSGGEKLLDEIVEKTGLSIIAINTTLTYLEMKGLVRNIGGGRWKSQA
ncbi:MAG: DNA-processing protein DprA [Candidatus Berkelbacteria bacterium]